uniref:Uncharacterized protein n=1 Tax=Arion vulgaris TaxID=1028688 RepID=A0A0B6Y8K8_9EUPU
MPQLELKRHEIIKSIICVVCSCYLLGAQLKILSSEKMEMSSTKLPSWRSNAGWLAP